MLITALGQGPFGHSTQSLHATHLTLSVASPAQNWLPCSLVYNGPSGLVQWSGGDGPEPGRRALCQEGIWGFWVKGPVLGGKRQSQLHSHTCQLTVQASTDGRERRSGPRGYPRCPPQHLKLRHAGAWLTCHLPCGPHDEDIEACLLLMTFSREPESASEVDMSPRQPCHHPGN